DEIRHLTDVNVNKLFQPWRTFGAVINKCLTGKSSGFDSFRLSQAQLLSGLYHSRNINYAFLIWEDFVYQMKHKKQKKGIEMYYPRFTKVVIHHFMSKDLSIPRRNKINWNYVRDDNIFSTIKVVSRHQETQQYGAILPINLTNEDIRNTMAYKEYYAYATGVAAPKPKASARKKKGDSDTSLTPPIATPTLITTAAPVPRLSAAKGKQPARAITPTELTDVQRTKPNNSKLHSKGADKRHTYLNNVVQAGSESDKDDDDNNDEEELAKNDDKDTESGKGGDEVNESEGESDDSHL
nr:hypothetical protein [Tanacetum cinerariifolium]